MKHLYHPLIAHLPLGFWIASLACDLFYLTDGGSTLAEMAFYSMLCGLISAALSVPGGIADFRSVPSGTEAKRIAARHHSLNLAATILYIVNFFARHGLEQGTPSFITPGEMVLSVVAVSLLAVSGYVGGLLSGTLEDPLLSRPEVRRVA